MNENKPAGKAKMSKQGDREIHTERVFDAPREKVFTTMTDPELIPEWWGPRGTTTTVKRMDVKPGGEWHIVHGDDDDPNNAFRGTYKEVKPPERIVQTFEWLGLPGHVSVETLTLEDLGDGRTKVSGVSVFDSVEDRDGMFGSMEGGLNATYDRLEELLAK